MSGIQDLDKRFPIVGDDGKPTDYFMRLIKDRGQSSEDNSTAAADAQAAADAAQASADAASTAAAAAEADAAAALAGLSTKLDKPASITYDDAVARFDLATGNIKDSAAVILDSGAFYNSVLVHVDGADGYLGSLEVASYSSVAAFHGSRQAFLRSRGTISSPTAVTNADYIGWFDFFGYDGTGWTRAGQWICSVNGTVSAGKIPSKLELHLSDSTGTLQRAFTANPGSLEVNDDAYGSGWNGSIAVPTKNAVYDKIESLISSISSGGGGAWSVIDDHTLSGAVASYAVDVSAYDEVICFLVDVTASSSGRRGVAVSTDGGATYDTTGGNYLAFAPSGAKNTTFGRFSIQNVANTTATGGMVHIRNLRDTTAPKPATTNDNTDGGSWLYVGSNAAITNIRYDNSAGNLNAGRMITFGRKSISANQAINLGVMPALSGFTQENISGTRSITETAGKAFSIIESSPAATPKVAGVRKAVPASTPYRVAVFLQSNSSTRNYFGYAWGWSDGTKLHVMQMPSSGSLEEGKFTNSGSRSSTTVMTGSDGSLMGGVGRWLGMRDDGTNVYFEISEDGVNFTTVTTVAKASGYLGATGYTQIFVGMYTEGSSVTGTSYPHSVAIRTWDENGLTRSF